MLRTTVVGIAYIAISPAFIQEAPNEQTMDATGADTIDLSRKVRSRTGSSAASTRRRRRALCRS